MLEEQEERNKVTADTFSAQKKSEGLINKVANLTINDVGNDLIKKVENLTINDAGNNMIEKVAKLKINNIGNDSKRAITSDVKFQTGRQFSRNFSPKLIEWEDEWNKKQVTPCVGSYYVTENYHEQSTGYDRQKWGYTGVIGPQDV